ncbi:cold-shock protein [Streptomyces abikoensis]|uniref:Cold-shock protein n=1 Tax=Streptomyces abikoensis TaxID=97398 RepID=A0ABW7T7Z5_9ACTN
MAQGTVKYFHRTLGYGFLAPDSGGEDLYADHSQIRGAGDKVLKAGQRVEYEVGTGGTENRALNIRPL